MRYLPDAPNQAPAPAPAATLSADLCGLCAQAAERIANTTALPLMEAKRRLWETIKEAVIVEPIAEPDLSLVTPETIAASEADVIRQHASNARATAALGAAEADAKEPKRPHANCRTCGAPIRFLRTAEKKHTPVNLDGQPHWATCPQAGQWRRTK